MQTDARIGTTDMGTIQKPVETNMKTAKTKVRIFFIIEFFKVLISVLTISHWFDCVPISVCAIFVLNL